jgi:hypothetical protein
MSYTHYFTQTRDFTKKQWTEVCENITEILKDVQHVQGISLANGAGEPGTQPEVNENHIMLNGVGDDAYETLAVNRVRPAKERWQARRGTDFCKTARKPYDLAVTTVLSYLSTVEENFSVSSDGCGSDWLAGVEEARRALPRFANVLDIPMDVMREDR